MTEAFATGRKPATAWKIIAGAVLLLLLAAGNSARPLPDDLASSLGSLTGLTTLIAIGIALIASGLPRSIGNAAFVIQRRRLWLKLMLVGFLVMAIAVFGLLFFQLSSVLLIYAYWSVWPWLSWLLADGRTREQGLELPLFLARRP